MNNSISPKLVITTASGKPTSNVKPNRATLETIDYNAQMKEFFIELRCLNGLGLNPKSVFTIK